MTQKTECIVLVDDDPISNLVHESLISQELGDFDCLISFLDPNHALEHLRQENKTSLVLLDLVMPGLDGFEFLKKYQNFCSGNKGHKIVVVSNSTRTEDKERVLGLGAEDFVPKPNTEEKMKELLEKHFDLH